MTYWTAYRADGSLACWTISQTNEPPEGIHYTPQDGEQWLQITGAEWDALNGQNTGSVVDGTLTITPAPVAEVDA